MAINQDPLARDPKLARLMAAAATASPPAALDAAILAAARREVSARPQGTAGGGASENGSPRSKRHWYVPLSIAAVMVLSVSLVTMVHEEKGSELAQPPGAAGPPSAAPAQPVAKAPATPEPKADVGPDDRLTPPPSSMAPPPPTPPAVAPQPEAPRKLATPRADAEAPVAPAARSAQGSRRKQEEHRDAARKHADETVATPSRDEARAAGAVTPPEPKPATPERLRTAEPFPGATAPEASVAAAAPPPRQAPASTDARQPPARSRAEPDPQRNSRQDALAKEKATADAPATAEADQASTAPAITGGSIFSPAKPAARAPAGSALKFEQRREDKRVSLWLDLENQPAEKWLERIAQLRRDQRSADADTLLGEFRRRFPDHPAGLR